ncbi:MAG TPA: hypothetical protein VLA02_17950, partial [Reyranella sp.]|nr:hypothetical protein [Reyranella sp.]
EAIKRGDYTAAEKAVADAEKADPKAAAVAEVRAELKTAEERARRDRPRNPPPSTATLPPIPPAPGAAPARPQ